MELATYLRAYNFLNFWLFKLMNNTVHVFTVRKITESHFLLMLHALKECILFVLWTWRERVSRLLRNHFVVRSQWFPFYYNRYLWVFCCFCILASFCVNVQTNEITKDQQHKMNGMEGVFVCGYVVFRLYFLYSFCRF